VELNHVELVSGGEYSKKAASFGRVFDIVVIDGRDRVNCALNCLDSLREGGVIIWDNTNRKHYGEGFDFLARQGYRRLDFEGMAPGVIKTSKTTIFYKENNCLKI
jgi:predicted O-methyltransferase YrrM